MQAETNTNGNTPKKSPWIIKHNPHTGKFRVQREDGSDVYTVLSKAGVPEQKVFTLKFNARRKAAELNGNEMTASDVAESWE